MFSPNLNRKKCYYFANPSTVSVCLSVCTCTTVCPDACIYNAEVLSMCNGHLMLGQTAVIYTHTSNSCHIHSYVLTLTYILKHTSTPTQVHTSWYSRHLCHILESVGRHRRDTLKGKIQFTTLRGAGARAHERRTGVVAAEGAAAKGHCPWDGRARDGA